MSVFSMLLECASCIYNVYPTSAMEVTGCYKTCIPRHESFCENEQTYHKGTYIRKEDYS